MEHRTPELAAHAKVAPLDGLTSLRFFAAFYVLLFHYSGAFFGAEPKSGFLSYGYSGVTFFFVLSGFILAYNYKKTDFGAPGSVGKFLIARFARIYPVYLVTLIIAIPFFYGDVVRHHTGALLVAASAILAPLGLHAWVPGAACSLNCPSWSISTEFFFYLLFPFLLAPVLRRPGRWAAAAIALFLLSCLVMSGVWAAFGDGGSPVDPHTEAPLPVRMASEFVKYFPMVRLPEFIGGIALYALWERHGKAVPPWAPLAAAAAGALVLFFAAPRLPVVALHNGLTALCWVPVIWAGANARGGIIGSKALLFLGKISFALYLVHNSVLYAVGAVDKRLFAEHLKQNPLLLVLTAGMLSLAASALLHIFVEERCRHALLRLFRPQPARPAIEAAAP